MKGLSPQGTAPEWYYHFDGLGSVTNLTNSTGAIAESYTYDAFGKPNTTSSLGNRFMFTGREYDSETGLYYYRARYYSPELGRFLQRDPLEIDDENTYTYCYNDPINYIDPYGYQGIIPNVWDPGIFGPGVWGPGGWKPPVDIWPPPGGDIGLPRPPIPGENAPPNTKRKEAPLTQQQGISENATNAAKEKGKGKKEEKEKEKRKKTIKEHWKYYRNPRDPYEKEYKRKEIRELIRRYRERFGRD